ncbi:hypothetical protein [Galbibacter orientalis]|uniref:hypothetical protein n=1 Tax=Galbibacter orientalis TaxID=453852 RepID=UPI003080C3DC
MKEREQEYLKITQEQYDSLLELCFELHDMELYLSARDEALKNLKKEFKKVGFTKKHWQEDVYTEEMGVCFEIRSYYYELDGKKDGIEVYINVETRMKDSY